MKCPFCNESMEQGKLRSRGGVFFLPDGEKIPKLHTEKEMKKHNAISFPPYALDNYPCYPDAFVCRSCGKIIMEIEPE